MILALPCRDSREVMNNGSAIVLVGVNPVRGVEDGPVILVHQLRVCQGRCQFQVNGSKRRSFLHRGFGGAIVLEGELGAAEIQIRGGQMVVERDGGSELIARLLVLR